MDLNSPGVRLQILRERLSAGTSLVASDLASEFGISVDTVRRDMIALERDGAARRVRGGAIPLSRPSADLHVRRGVDLALANRIALCAIQRLRGATTLLIDGGTTCQAFARILEPAPDLVVVTPSPFVACETFRRGIETQILPGRLSAKGGIAVGLSCGSALVDLSADAALIGACALDPDFGLSSDDMMESAIKHALASAATQVFVLADSTKLCRRARHRTLEPGEIDLILTDASALQTMRFVESGIEVIHA